MQVKMLKLVVVVLIHTPLEKEIFCFIYVIDAVQNLYSDKTRKLMFTTFQGEMTKKNENEANHYIFIRPHYNRYSSVFASILMLFISSYILWLSLFCFIIVYVIVLYC